MAAGTHILFPADTYAALSIGVALFLELTVPLQFLPEATLGSWTTPVGLLVAGIGLGLEIAAARSLNGAGTTTRPNEAPTALVTGGPFRFSRNPFYIGIILLIAGGCIAGSLEWWLLISPLFWLALDRFVAPFEERRLEGAFGEAYRAYVVKTPRWLF